MEQKKEELEENKEEEVKEQEEETKEIKEENTKETKSEEEPKKEVKEENTKETKSEEEPKKEVKEKNKKETKSEEEPKKEVKEENRKETKSEEEPKKEVKEENRKETKSEEKSKKEPKVETEKMKDEQAKEKEEEKASKQETKKFEVKNNNKKEKSKNKKTTWLVKVLPALAIICIAVLLTIMIVTSSDPKKSVDGFLTNLKAGDFEKAKEFLTGDEISKEQELDEEIQKLLFDKITWKVKNVEIDNNNATVELEITNKDFEIIVSNCMKKAMDNLKTAILGGDLIEQDMEKYFIDELKNEQVQTKTQTKNIQLVKENDKWKIESNEELVDVLLPELQQAVNSLT